MIYLNEHDSGAAEWCRELMRDGLIPEGQVDERSICDIQPIDLEGVREAHFFAGIAGWPYALRLAGWPVGRPVWTGSCPCQPFSAAGKRKGEADERDLWPEFFRLISACRPPVVFGEQVASADVVGAAGGKPRSDGRRVWLDRVSADLEAAGYAVGACVLGSHSVGAPHIRQRLYWVARLANAKEHGASAHIWEREPNAERCGTTGGLADAGRGNYGVERRGESTGRGEPCRTCRGRGWILRKITDDYPFTCPDCLFGQPGTSRWDGGLEHATSDGRRQGWAGADGRGVAGGCGVGGVGDTDSKHQGSADNPTGSGDTRRTSEGCGLGDTSGARPQERGSDIGIQREAGLTPAGQTTQLRGPWSDSCVIDCRDGKRRRIPTEPALFPLAHGLSPGRVGILRGAGNAINPYQAAAFIRAFLETTLSDSKPSHEPNPQPKEES